MFLLLWVMLIGLLCLWLMDLTDVRDSHKRDIHGPLGLTRPADPAFGKNGMTGRKHTV